jgi:phosphoglycerate dehydrogenase-like enzyme
MVPPSSAVRVAVTSRSFSQHGNLPNELRERFEHVRLNSDGASLAGDALVDFLTGHDAAIIALERIDEGVLSRLPDLRVVSKFGVGLDGLDLDAMERRGVLLGWSPGVNAKSVAELTVGAMIALLHRVPEASREVAIGKWRQIRGKMLSGRTVGIVGCGHVGKEVARLCRAFGCQVLVNDIRRYDEFYRANSVEAVELSELLAQAEVVTLHVPLDATTVNLLNGERLEQMRPGAVLINMARGGILDEAVVAQRLRDGFLLGAAFDVFGVEPPFGNPLLAMANVLTTPHIGGSTEEAVLAMGRAAILALSTAKPIADWRRQLNSFV